MIDIKNSLKRFKSLKELAKNNKGYIEPTLYASEIEVIIKALENHIKIKEVIGLFKNDMYDDEVAELFFKIKELVD